MFLHSINTLNEKFPIESQTTNADKSFLLNAIEFVKRFKSQYSYLEIGSFLGGSLAPFLLDADCSDVFSIDERGKEVADERGAKYDYAGISNQTMIDHLQSKGIETSKLMTFNGSIDAVSLSHRKFDVALIDGEHTDTACFRDFLWVEPLMEESAIILFHDSSLIYKAISHAALYMKRSGKKFSLWKNPLSDISAIFIGDFSINELSKDFGVNVEWGQFCKMSEKKILNSIVTNRLRLKFEILDEKVLPAY